MRFEASGAYVGIFALAAAKFSLIEFETLGTKKLFFCILPLANLTPNFFLRARLYIIDQHASKTVLNPLAWPSEMSHHNGTRPPPPQPYLLTYKNTYI